MQNCSAEVAVEVHRRGGELPQAAQPEQKPEPRPRRAPSSKKEPAALEAAMLRSAASCLALAATAAASDVVDLTDGTFADFVKLHEHTMVRASACPSVLESCACS